MFGGVQWVLFPFLLIGARVLLPALRSQVGCGRGVRYRAALVGLPRQRVCLFLFARPVWPASLPVLWQLVLGSAFGSALAAPALRCFRLAVCLFQPSWSRWCFQWAGRLVGFVLS
jgi:hypothetical protein